MVDPDPDPCSNGGLIAQGAVRCRLVLAHWFDYTTDPIAGARWRLMPEQFDKRE
jgi:hypothetical protein